LSGSYYCFTRSEIAPLLPQKASRILDVGCGAGSTSAWLRTIYPDAKLIGFEVSNELRSHLETILDEVHIVDLNSSTPRVAADLVLFLDVLEHLADPEDLLRKMIGCLPRDVTIIVSVPNIAHASVSLPLLFQGRFDYKDAGILDRTHLRFFYRDSAVALLNHAGLEVTEGLETGLGGPKSRFLDRITFGRLRNRLAKQYIMRANIMPPGQSQGLIKWLPV
jgi:2-polyprenyl-3-methyl-5-hydroxy-6-metoxy-1,4-benzoquinol methylase